MGQIIQWLKAEGAAQSEIHATIHTFANPWGIGYSKYDPLPALTAFKRPVFALFGGSDIQVSARDNAPTMENALSHPHSVVCVLPNKNHLFQYSKTDKLEEYSNITMTIEPSVLEKMGKWLHVVTNPSHDLDFICE